MTIERCFVNRCGLELTKVDPRPTEIENVSGSGVIVLEKRPRWTPELQRQFADERVRVRSCQTPADVEHMLRAAANSLLVVDLEAGTAECLQLLGRLFGRRWSSPIIVVGSRATAQLEWPVRELGVLAFLTGVGCGDELARLCRRWQSQSAGPYRPGPGLSAPAPQTR